MYLLTLFDLGSKIYYEEGAVVFSKDGFYFYPAHYDRSTQSKWPWQETGGRLLVCLDDSVELWLADKISCLFYPITIQLNRPNACLLTAKPFTVCRSNLVNLLFQCSIQWIIRIIWLSGAENINQHNIMTWKSLGKEENKEYSHFLNFPSFIHIYRPRQNKLIQFWS